jgi:hypothetical protein
VILEKGSAFGGASALQAVDDLYYHVNGTATEPRETQWIAQFTNVPTTLQKLTITVRDKCSGAATRTIEILNVTSGTWVVLDQRTLSGSWQALTLSTPGPASAYVNASGQMQVRLRTVRSGSLQRHRTDVLVASYTP